MNRIIHQLAISASVFVISLLPANPALAQPGGCCGYGSCYGGNYQQRMYKTQSIEDITGQVISVHNITSPRNTSGGVHLIVKTAKEDIDVHLGPAWYINNQNIKINLQDKIRVRGWRISIAGKPAIIAAEVAKGDQVITLRNPDGSPLWSGRERWY
ncbi:MAG: hypothetical protein QNJ63_15465 [Calothrix sp. MO_192.B10]|nr:hypothetical protein [Calothrix sp. MO_192.B10]